jgi:hypothetical protein
MNKITLLILFVFLQKAVADSGTMKVGVFSNNTIAVELTGEAITTIKGLTTSSRNIECSEELCRFDLDNNGKAKRPRLVLADAPRKDEHFFSLQTNSKGNLTLEVYNVTSIPQGGTLAKILHDVLVAESQKPGSKVKGEAITNHDYAYTGVHLTCTDFASGDYSCELGIAKSGITKP